MSLPLQGIRILDLTRLLPGGLATLMLADLGADVIKVEAPEGGDYARWTPPVVDGMGALFRLLNRNKRSAILNLKDPRGQAALKRLTLSADVLIESFRPGVLARLNSGAAVLRETQPRLIYCSLSGWGQYGPYAHLPGHDLNYVSLGGSLGAMLRPQPPGGQIADVGGAYVAVAGVLAALFRRERTGEGAALDLSLFESGLPFASIQWLEALYGVSSSLTGHYAWYNVYKAGDGLACALAALEPKFWENFCRAVARPDWIAHHLEMDKQAYLIQELQQMFATQPLAFWRAALEEQDCCFTAVTHPAHLAADAHIQARAALGQDAAGHPWLASPIRLDQGAAPAKPPPGHGEHTRVVLSEAGFTEGEIEALIYSS
jgi:crotonobetainyl-CoA:carnitine CoA-transferase CaiB-like acyl-CoA transferase